MPDADEVERKGGTLLTSYVHVDDTCTYICHRQKKMDIFFYLPCQNCTRISKKQCNMHIMAIHVPEMIRRDGNIKQFSCQGEDSIGFMMIHLPLRQVLRSSMMLLSTATSVPANGSPQRRSC